MASADEHPALRTEHSDLPNVTLVLPAHLDADQALRGLLTSIEQTRDGLLSWARRFRQLEKGYAASGDRLCQAQCRGQSLGPEHAAGMLDQEIIEAFDLWQQYEAQDPGPDDGDDRSAASPNTGCGDLVPEPRDGVAEHPGLGDPGAGTAG
jgi:hypothetical protein